jgi:hypothetical protein
MYHLSKVSICCIYAALSITIVSRNLLPEDNFSESECSIKVVTLSDSIPKATLRPLIVHPCRRRLPNPLDLRVQIAPRSGT